jgi:DNA-binding transcriptional ArsR family regulator
VLRLWLEPDDLARVRVPATLHRAATVMLVCQALRAPAVAAALPDLARRAASARLRPLHHLVQPRGLAPDFITPLDGVHSLEAGLEAIRSAAPRQIRAEVAAAYAHVPASGMRRRFADADPAVLDALVAAIGHYFRDVLAPAWPAMTRIHRHLVDEVAHRFARAGVDGVLSGLPAGLRWRSPVLEADTWPTAGPMPDRDIRLGGQGILLVPSMFAGPRPRVMVQPDRPALVVYQAGSPAALADLTDLAGRTPPDAGVERLLGRTRAAVLRRVAGPGRHTTSTVARGAGISVSSSSEHLAALRAAGLVSSQRTGGAVVHRATLLGARLSGG